MIFDVVRLLPFSDAGVLAMTWGWSDGKSTEFTLPDEYAIGAVFFFAITGALAAMRRHYDLIGVFAMAFVTGLGGGLIRDGIFIQNGPPALTRDARYMTAVAGGCLVGWTVGFFIERFPRLIAVVDAAGLAVFSVVGVQMSYEAGLSVPASILVGMINACGGGLLRDVIVREEPLMLRPGQFYVFASLIGSVLFAYLTKRTALNSFQAALTAIGATFALRVLAIRFNWRTKSIKAWGGDSPPQDDQAKMP
jgi:uncharacterized membrane protein YeiH